jgi:hypothetical protein
MWPIEFPEMARIRNEELRRAAEAYRLARRAHRAHRERRHTVLVSDRLAGALVALRVANPASGERAVRS